MEITLGIKKIAEPFDMFKGSAIPAIKHFPNAYIAVIMYSFFRDRIAVW